MRLLLVLLLAALPLNARQRTIRPTTTERVLWIAAHPDDEAMLAPLLGKKCVEERADCTFLVLTRGEAGECKLPGGCGDVGALRAAEMASAATMFRARLIHWSLPDVFNPEAVWPASLRGDIADVIATVRPDVIYTFDPHHGSSCHPAHTYTAQLVLEVAGGVRVQMIETWINRSNGIAFEPATAQATIIDVRRWWSWLVDDLEAHPSQFSPDEIRAIARLPEDQHKIWLMERSLLHVANYDVACVTARKRSCGK